MATSPAIQAPEFEDHTSIFETLSAILKRWRSAFGIPLFVTLVVIVVSLFVPNVYTARTTFVPEASSETNLPSGLAGLAGQLGINFGSEASQSPRFYAEVVKSRAILDRLLTATYANTLSPETPSDSTTLLTILRKGHRNRPDSLERAATRLASLMSVSIDAQTNIVTVKATLPDRDLAAAVLQRLISYLNDFNTQTRQSQARERRKFTEQRVASVENELRDAEEALKRFYQSNRSWQQSPQLVFEEGQLRRQVDLRQELYRTLRREYETARIQEVNDTPAQVRPETKPLGSYGTHPRGRLLDFLGIQRRLLRASKARSERAVSGPRIDRAKGTDRIKGNGSGGLADAQGREEEVTVDQNVIRRLVKGWSANLYGQAVVVLIQLAGVPILLHYWHPQLYGEWLILFA